MDSYRRFVQMYGDVVLGMKPEKKTDIDPFEHLLEEKKHKAGVKFDSDLSVAQLKELVAEFKAAIKSKTGKEFPNDPKQQVWGAIGAVFGSWMKRPRYRVPPHLRHSARMGNRRQRAGDGVRQPGDDCATGVALTRDGALGVPGYCGDYLINAQGEDVVAGIRTPKRIEETLAQEMPKAFAELDGIGKILEGHYKDVQDIEFTVEKGKVWMLQTRNAKRTGFAAVRIAVDLVREGKITDKEALSAKRIPADDLNQLLQPVFDLAGKKSAVAAGKLLTKAINAGPGAATGQIVFHADDAEKKWLGNNSVEMILVRRETTPEDLRGMKVAKGILTAFGGASSHAALVSRQMGKVCVVGASDLVIDYESATLSVGGKTYKEGDYISIDGFTGEVFEGKVQTKPSEVIQVLISKTMKPEESEVYGRFAELMMWVNKYRKLRIRTNADQPNQATEAVAFGAEGIGLCRTEHMFFDHIGEFREMILATDLPSREKALAKLLPFQRDDFLGLFKAMVRVPAPSACWTRRSTSSCRTTTPSNSCWRNGRGFRSKRSSARVHELHESNPMLGHRGCRLGIVYPEITAMQARAIFEAAVLAKQAGVEVKPEVMVPLVASRRNSRIRKDHPRTGGEGFRREESQGRLPRGNDDRSPAGRDLCRPDRQERRVLQLRHERPDANRSGDQPRRLRRIHQRLQGKGHHPVRPVPDDRSGRYRRTDEAGCQRRPSDSQRPEDRHLRRAWRRPGLGDVLSPDRTGLRELLAVPGADRGLARRRQAALAEAK